MKIVQCSQGSIEWFEARCGRVTASDVAKVMAFLKRGDKQGGDTAARADYKASIISEILTGEPDMDGFATGPMNRGIDEEPRAREVYEMVTDTEVDRVGFVIHPTIERAGASPDGIVGTDGMIEVKCPKSKTHINYMLTGILPAEYEPQVMFELACTEREWCDFISYDSRMPRRHRMFIKRIYRNDARIAEINAAVLQFLCEADETIAALERMNPEIVEAARKQPDVDPTLGITDEDFPAWMRGDSK